MRFSYSLKKNIFETAVGGLMNKLHLHKRRDTLFFSDIFMNYIKECEDAGYGEKMKIVAQKWMILCLKNLIPDALKKLPPIFFLNNIMKRVWINLGLMDDLYFTKSDDIIEINTENEAITKNIGKNEFSIGLFIGVLNVLFNCKIEIIEKFQTKEKSKYVLKLKTEGYSDINSKEKADYDKLNYLPEIKGFTLKDIFENGMFHLDEKNKIQFRGKYIYPVENTLFHLLSNEKLLMEKLPEISYNYFKEIIKESDDKEKLILLKTLLQTMGWGIITMVLEENEIKVEIKNPPYGLQTEDNWNFLIQTILGYMWLIDKKFKIENIKKDYKILIIKFSK